MPTTFTASSQSATPRVNHTGVIPATASFHLNAAQSTSVSDLILLVKIPDRAFITNGYVSGTIGNVASAVKIGTSADDDACLVLGTLSLTSQRTNFNATTLPFQVSLSDDAEPKWTWLRAEFVTSPSSCLTMSVRVYVEYSMPGAI
jgi:hypothetical protein